MKKTIKFLRAVSAVLIGCLFVIPLLFSIATVLVLTGFVERNILGTNLSNRIAKYLGDDGAELLKTIAGTK